MTAILMKAGCFIAIILLGYMLRRIGVFQKEDFHVLSKLVLKVTLPAALVSSVAGYLLKHTVPQLYDILSGGRGQ